MKALLFMLTLLIGFNASAQSIFGISGKVTDEKEKPVAGATIFIDGTQMVTETNTEGKFELAVAAGAYHLTVKMMGYKPDSRDLLVKDKSIDLDINLTVKPIVLKPVNIGTDKDWAKNYAIFKKEFLGDAKGCEILNPEVLYFSTEPNKLYANADDFLIIENKRLGYRIKYLLQTFEHSTSDNAALAKVFVVEHKTVGRTAYNGEVFFENLQGTEYQKLQWTKNRIVAYNGSMMHFLRSVFTHTCLHEGFLTNIPVSIDSAASNKLFVAYDVGDLYVTYDPKQVTQILKQVKSPENDAAIKNLRALAENPVYKNELVLSKSEVMIDSRGSMPSAYLLSFLIRGDWIKKRVGDQLPFEYQPALSTSIAP